MENIIEQDDYIVKKRRHELIDDIVYMSPAPSVKHNKIMLKISFEFEHYLRGKKCSVNVGVNVFYNPDKPKNHVIPDISVMCEPEKFKPNGYYGAPSLIVEIVSTNRKDDLITKFNLYERIGVTEYWIVEPLSDSINQYILVDGRYKLIETYQHLSPEDIELMDEDEQEEHKLFVKPTIFDDLEIPLEYIFGE
ncbi:MAG: hypothetical protein ATN35_12890 [Epulopiscium sp. Nele67-Bin004]|nr:MAG: hypothetical protein ATN35_12890 [Epulopiscium sp. Nele67-Bin004]